MQGGEIFVPKIPSVRITDLAKAMAPEKEIKIIGIRPGEKLHETMCPKDDAHLTLEFKDHYVIRPTISFGWHVDYTKNLAGEKGKQVDDYFEYNSENNDHFMTIDEIRQMNDQLGLAA